MTCMVTYVFWIWDIRWKCSNMFHCKKNILPYGELECIKMFPFKLNSVLSAQPSHWIWSDRMILSCLDSLTKKKEAGKELPSFSLIKGKKTSYFISKMGIPERTHTPPSENHQLNLKWILGTCFLWGNVCDYHVLHVCVCVFVAYNWWKCPMWQL